MLRVGRLSEDDKQFIRDHAATLDPKRIAARLNKTSKCVEDFVAALRAEPVLDPAMEKRGLIEELRQSGRYRRLKDELTRDELKTFEDEYSKLMAQFKQDVQPSEETQIFDVIMYGLLKSRNMVGRKTALEEISKMEEELRSVFERRGKNFMMAALPKGKAADEVREDRERVQELREQIKAAKSDEQAKTTEYVKLQERQDKLMESLKGTRDQRVKEIESSKDTFLGLLKNMQKKEWVEKEGRQAGLLKLAAEEEYKRLGRPHKFGDGVVDRPILSPETLDLEAEGDDGENGGDEEAAES